MFYLRFNCSKSRTAPFDADVVNAAYACNAKLTSRSRPTGSGNLWGPGGPTSDLV